uniref:Uncharacterized protein n=1 Tax=Caenorhabditis japonica TaxID=281687 RepID=A0A8R1IAP9_CAEJA
MPARRVASKTCMPVKEQIKIEIVVRGKKALVTRCPELKKEAEVLAKPYLIETLQSDAKIVARAEACIGKAICREAEKKCVPTNQCSKSEERRMTRVVTNRVFIKRNHGIGVGSRSGAKCTQKPLGTTGTDEMGSGCADESEERKERGVKTDSQLCEEKRKEQFQCRRHGVASHKGVPNGQTATLA